jgi:redox-sensitive bicupin YhaK (pirin superfamily)
MEETMFIKADTRGRGDYGWLKTNYYFSFSNYYNPLRVGFGNLLVINDDVLAPDNGFPFHSHKDMEIVTIVLEGELEHKDSLGNIGKITKGEIQRMSAGTGITHSEYNSSDKNPLKLFQIWIETDKVGMPADYEQKNINFESIGSHLLISPKGEKDSLKINQNTYFSIVNLEKGEKFEYKNYDKENGIFVLLIDGEIKVGNFDLEKRDALGLYDKKEIEINSKEKSSVLIIEVKVD